ncbi:MAG: hypothetical protein CMA15_00595 [Euryarchaeota archaeon]|nr:hypothetical protein [Euryarchaeota archaeon]
MGLDLEPPTTKHGITKPSSPIGTTGPFVSSGEKPAPMLQKERNSPNEALNSETLHRRWLRKALETSRWVEKRG